MLKSRDSSWNTIQQAALALRKQVAGPTRSERQKLLGGGSNEQRFQALLQHWREAQLGQNVVVMVGAGVSVSAGFPDFRDKESGVYAKIQKQHGMARPESVFMHEEYEANPGPLCLWLQEFLEVREKAVPTTTHHFLHLLHEKGCLLRCYTQNIDGLELAAGLPRERVVMAHGNMLQPSCVACGARFPLQEFEKEVRAGNIPKCQKVVGRNICGKPVRPDITFFSEPTNIPPDFQQDFDKCDLLIILGTSLNVNPFANLATRVPALCPRLLINRDRVKISHCRHSSRQLVFDGSRAYRDMWLGGQCDESVRLIASLIGWHVELMGLEARFRGSSPPDAQKLQLNSLATDFSQLKVSSRQTSPTPSIGKSSFSGDDLISELSSELPMIEAESPATPASGPSRVSCPAYYGQLPGGPLSPGGMKPVASQASMVTMISELSGNDSDGDLVMVDSHSGYLVTI
jgi:NAD-dependent deacetylase sirtuin 2